MRTGCPSEPEVQFQIDISDRPDPVNRTADKKPQLFRPHRVYGGRNFQNDLFSAARNGQHRLIADLLQSLFDLFRSIDLRIVDFQQDVADIDARALRGRINAVFPDDVAETDDVRAPRFQGKSAGHPAQIHIISVCKAKIDGMNRKYRKKRYNHNQKPKTSLFHFTPDTRLECAERGVIYKKEGVKPLFLYDL